MKEVREIVAGFERMLDAGESGVLASVVRVSGSTYRRVGARLLILPDDSMIGLISGGCLEGDLLEHARGVLGDGRAKLVQYDAGDEDDLVWGLGLGCAGRVEVLLERVGPEAPGPLPELRRRLESHTRGALATRLSGPAPGARAALDEADAEPRGAEAGPLVASALRDTLQDGRVRYVHDAGEAWLVEQIPAPLHLMLFGAGADAVPLAQLADALGWRVAVHDDRPAFADKRRFPRAEVHCCPADEAVARLQPGPESHCVLMTHRYLQDLALLQGLLKSPAPYLALLGPKQRSRMLLAELARRGVATEDDAVRARLFAPAGLDIGADAPEQIALAIAAEIQAFHAGRSGGRLRERKGPIHDPPAV